METSGTIYNIVYSKKIKKDLKKIDKQYQNQIKKSIENLTTDPFSKVDKTENKNLATYKTRTGDYRILLEINTLTNEIEIVHIAHRSKVYSLK